MKQDNNATTRVKKYSELREDIKNSKETSSLGQNKNADFLKTKTIPLNNNEAMDTETIEIRGSREQCDEKKVKNAEVFKSYQQKKIISIALYILGALVVLVLVILLIVWMINRL